MRRVHIEGKAAALLIHTDDPSGSSAPTQCLCQHQQADSRAFGDSSSPGAPSESDAREWPPRGTDRRAHRPRTWFLIREGAKRDAAARVRSVDARLEWRRLYRDGLHPAYPRSSASLRVGEPAPRRCRPWAPSSANRHRAGAATTGVARDTGKGEPHSSRKARCRIGTARHKCASEISVLVRRPGS